MIFACIEHPAKAKIINAEDIKRRLLERISQTLLRLIII